jgi:hypothetical protein
VVGGAGSDPRLVVVTAANVLLDRRGKAAVGDGRRMRIDDIRIRSGIVEQTRNQHRGSARLPRDRFVVVVERAEDRPRATTVAGDEKWLAGSVED